MTSRRSRLRHSIGSSWSEAEEEPDTEYVQYSSELESGSELDEDSDKELGLGQTKHNKATPPSSKSTRSISGSIHKTPRSTSNKYPERMAQLKTPKSTPRSTNSAHTTPQSEEPSFIMPSMNSPTDSYARGSPMPKPEFRMRKQRKSAEHNTANGSPRQRKRMLSITDEPTPENEEVSPWHYVFLFYRNFILPLVTYVLDIVGYANRHFLKPILGLALGVGVLVLGIQFASSILYSRLNAAIAPVCLIPGSSYVFSMCAVPEQGGQANFEELIKVQSHFEEVLDASKDTSTLPATLKDSEIAIRDLRTLVKHSRLPSRNQLDLEFHNFVLTAKEAANDLSRYNSRIGSALDRVIGTNTWTMAVLQGLEESEANKGAVGRVLNAVAGTFIAPSPTLEQRIFDQYVSHVSKNKDEITSLIEQAQALLTVLTNLDERLDTIFAITVNDDETISRSQDELLSSLWTKLGGNSASVKANIKNLNLLRDITQYRHKALKHVSETLLKLQEIQAELEGLREGVAAPEILGWRHGLPITYHIELVERGVQRLRIARGESEKVEREALRARLGGVDRAVKELGDGKAAPPVVTVRAK